MRRNCYRPHADTCGNQGVSMLAGVVIGEVSNSRSRIFDTRVCHWLGPVGLGPRANGY